MSRKKLNQLLTFWAVTWNVYFGTKVADLQDVLDRLLCNNITMFLMQEAGGKDITKWLERNELRSVVYDEYRIAWNPREWLYIRHRSRLVSKVPMFRGKGKKPVYKYIIIAVFQHIPSGRRIKVISYHTPSHIQRPEWNRNAPGRWQIFKDAMFLFGVMAEKTVGKALLFGGDDNADETKASGGKLSRWRFALKNGLLQVQAPEPTHDTRKIDDFRIKGLTVEDPGFVGYGGGDHKFFACKFRFKRKRRRKKR